MSVHPDHHSRFSVGGRADAVIATPIDRWLAVSDSLTTRTLEKSVLEAHGYQVAIAVDGVDALNRLRAGPVGLVISDLQMPRLDGFSVCAELRRVGHSVPVLMLTAKGQIEDRVKGLDVGADDYLVKPFEAEQLEQRVARYVRSSSVPGTAAISLPVAEDPVSRKLLTLATRVAQSDVTVLLSGESGTGKEILARFIHTHSKRAAGPFVAVNCAAIPEQMLEAILFGHEKGAFTGAQARSVGKFVQANGGTLRR